MGILQGQIPSNWNYFLHLEDDVSKIARWIEFSEKNFECYSVELARLLMTASSEIDVVAKKLCERFNKEANAKSINRYRDIIVETCPKFPEFVVEIPRYGLKLQPWINWRKPENPPFWWTSYNKVKHHRTENFQQANLANTLNATSGLYILLLLLYHDHHGEFVPPAKLFTSLGFALHDGNYLRVYGCGDNN